MNKISRVIQSIVAIIGALMIVCGIVFYSITSSQLRSESITVAPLNEGKAAGMNGPGAGKIVAGPFTALNQINAIGYHMKQASAIATGGTKDADTGAVTGGWTGIGVGNAPAVSLDKDGRCAKNYSFSLSKIGGPNGELTCEKGKPAEATGALKIKDEGTGVGEKPVGTALSGLKGTFQTGSLLQGSIYVSILAFGLSTLIAGLGILFVLLGLAPLIGGKKRSLNAISV